MVTRALGDADVKGDGVTADPEVSETRLTASDEYFVMACDGLWDVVGRCSLTVSKPVLKAPMVSAISA